MKKYEIDHLRLLYGGHLYVIGGLAVVIEKGIRKG